MALEVIGAGLGRTGTLSLKLALEHIGVGKCYHMTEVLQDAPRNLPLWLAACDGAPDWDAIFAGFLSTSDYPACTFWRELAAYYPEAKIVLSVRDPERWFESVSATVFSPEHRARFEHDPAVARFFAGAIFTPELEARLGDRAAMIDYFNRWNQAVIDEVPADRLLVHKSADGWEPLCAFLGKPVPPEPYPRVNSREEMTVRTGELDSHEGPPPPEAMAAIISSYLEDLRRSAFP